MERASSPGGRSSADGVLLNLHAATPASTVRSSSEIRATDSPDTADLSEDSDSSTACEAAPSSPPCRTRSRPGVMRWKSFDPNYEIVRPNRRESLTNGDGAKLFHSDTNIYDDGGDEDAILEAAAQSYAPAMPGKGSLPPCPAFRRSSIMKPEQDSAAKAAPMRPSRRASVTQDDIAVGSPTKKRPGVGRWDSRQELPVPMTRAPMRAQTQPIRPSRRVSIEHEPKLLQRKRTVMPASLAAARGRIWGKESESEELLSPSPAADAPVWGKPSGNQDLLSLGESSSSSSDSVADRQGERQNAPIESNPTLLSQQRSDVIPKSFGSTRRLLWGQPSVSDDPQAQSKMYEACQAGNFDDSASPCGGKSPVRGGISRYPSHAVHRTPAKVAKQPHALSPRRASIENDVLSPLKSPAKSPRRRGLARWNSYESLLPTAPIRRASIVSSTTESTVDWGHRSHCDFDVVYHDSTTFAEQGHKSMSGRSSWVGSHTNSTGDDELFERFLTHTLPKFTRQTSEERFASAVEAQPQYPTRRASVADQQPLQDIQATSILNSGLDQRSRRGNDGSEASNGDGLVLLKTPFSEELQCNELDQSCESALTFTEDMGSLSESSTTFELLSSGNVNRPAQAVRRTSVDDSTWEGRWHCSDPRLASRMTCPPIVPCRRLSIVTAESRQETEASVDLIASNVCEEDRIWGRTHSVSHLLPSASEDVSPPGGKKSLDDSFIQKWLGSTAPSTSVPTHKRSNTANACLMATAVPRTDSSASSTGSLVNTLVRGARMSVESPSHVDGARPLSLADGGRKASHGASFSEEQGLVPAVLSPAILSKRLGWRGSTDLFAVFLTNVVAANSDSFDGDLQPKHTWAFSA